MKNSSMKQSRLHTSESLSVFEKAYFSLTHELLRCLKVNQFSFSILLLIEALQIVHFSLKDASQWSSEIIKYMATMINYISIDYLVKQNPGIFVMVLGCATGILLITGLAMVYIAKKTYAEGDKISQLASVVISLTGLVLLLLRTVLQIPYFWLIGLSFSVSAKELLLIETLYDPIIISLGIVCGVLFAALQFYISTSFYDCNPFSDIQFTGESGIKCLVKLVYKFLLTAYLLADIQGSFTGPFSIIFAIVNTVLAIYYHWEQGYSKQFMRVLSLRLHYFVSWFGFCGLLTNYSTGQEITIITFMVVLYACLVLVLHFIEDLITERRLRQKSMFLTSDSEIENHVLGLVKLVDTIEKRKSRILIEGYLCYHHRLCKLPENECHCHSLINIKQRDREEQKKMFFHLLVDILNEGISRFPDSKIIYLLLTFIYQYRQKNRFRAIYSITKTLKRCSFFDHLYFFHQINLVEYEMKEDDAKQNLNKTVDINKFLIFNNLIVSFEKTVEFCVKDYMDFWKELLETNINIKRLEQCGSTITNRKEEVKNQFNQLVLLNPNNIHCLVIYGNFLSQVTNDENSHQKYIEKSDNIFKNLKESSKIDQSGNKYTENAQTTIVVISGNEGELGNVVHTNNFVQKTLGYKRSELIHQNVAGIMPRIFGETHNQVLNRYLSTSAERFNGRERLVPALAKDGYMVPCVALTKAIPDLCNGIQIVGFINKFQQKPDEQDLIIDYVYMLYRTDSQIVMGISRNCYTQLGISSCLVYGNPNNSMNQLKIQHLFGMSFEKDSSFVSNLDNGVFVTINTTTLEDDFIITHENTEECDQNPSFIKEGGIQTEVSVKSVLSLVYNGVPLRLISIDTHEPNKSDKSLVNGNSKADLKAQFQQSALSCRSENDDMKDLKDFKNFISIKNEPSAIKSIRYVCIAVIFMLVGAIGSMTFLTFKLDDLHELSEALVKEGRINSLILPEILAELEKLVMNQHASLRPTSLYNETLVLERLELMRKQVKGNQNEFLKMKYLLDSNYSITATTYDFDTTLQQVAGTKQLDGALTLHFAKFQSLIDNLDLILASNNPVSQHYQQIKYDTVFSLMKQSKVMNDQLMVRYRQQLNFLSLFIYAITGSMLLMVIMWLLLSVPYALSVAKINNRVLSLFSLIPEHQVSSIILKCAFYLRSYLSEAVVEESQELFHRNRIDADLNQKRFDESPSAVGAPSPNESFLPQDTSQMMMNKSHANTERSSYALNARKIPSKVEMEQKFNKMVNSENGDRQRVVCQYFFVALVMVGFILYIHFYSFRNISTVSSQIEIEKALGERTVAFRELKLLLTEYLMDEGQTIRQNEKNLHKLTTEKIDDVYGMERKLLDFEFANSYENLLFYYNTNNICLKINQYKRFSMMTEQFSKDECQLATDGVLIKGYKTAIVKILQQTRSVLTISGGVLNRTAQLQAISQYSVLQKYMQNSIFHIIFTIREEIQTVKQRYRIVFLASSGVFILIVICFWRLIWTTYIEELNMQIWRTKGMLNIIPMRIITNNDVLKNQFTSGHLEEAVR